MLWFLRLVTLAALVSMVAVTGWASTRCALFAVPREVVTHPWFLATLADAYWAFLAFYGWAAWKEQRLGARILWLVAVLALGTIAIAIYLLRELFAIGRSAELGELIRRRNPGHVVLPSLLCGVATVVYLLA